MSALPTVEAVSLRSGVPDFASHYMAEYERVLPTLWGQKTEWLRDLRELAMQRVQDMGIPGPRDEGWKYTNRSALTRRWYPLADAASSRSPDPAAFPAAINRLMSELGPAYCIQVVNGVCVGLPDALPPGISVSSVVHAAPEFPEAVRAVLSASATESAFEALNLAVCPDVVFIRVEASVQSPRPLHLQFVATDAVAQFPRVVVHLGTNAQLALIESYCGAGSPEYLTNAVADLHLEHGAVLDHCRVQLESSNAIHLAKQRVHLKGDAKYRACALTSGSLLSRSELTVGLEGTRADTALAGLYTGIGRQHQEHHVHVSHAQPATRSEQHFHGVLDGRAHGVFRGGVFVEPHAQKVDARQINRNLLLSAHAEATTQPQLQILADDVKCSHGATVGQLDEDALFYLRSRGLAPEIARGLLTRAFCQEVLERIEMPALRSALMAVLTTLWGQSGQTP